MPLLLTSSSLPFSLFFLSDSNLKICITTTILNRICNFKPLPKPYLTNNDNFFWGQYVVYKRTVYKMIVMIGPIPNACRLWGCRIWRLHLSKFIVPLDITLLFFEKKTRTEHTHRERHHFTFVKHHHKSS